MDDDGRQTFLEKGRKGPHCVGQYKDNERKTMRLRATFGSQAIVCHSLLYIDAGVAYFDKKLHIFAYF